jgi:hypothetical protein
MIAREIRIDRPIAEWNALKGRDGLGRGDRESYKEWYHFCVLGEAVQVIVNFSTCADRRPAAPHTLVSRVVMLIHDRDRGWSGAVETVPEESCRWTPGRIDAVLGKSWMSFSGGAFRIHAETDSPRFCADFTLRPLTQPIRRADSGLRDGALEGHLSWVAVPRLIAWGAVKLGEDREVRLDAAPAYHDHNWGDWSWGQDFGWQWGFALPDEAANPWTCVFDRVLDLGRRADTGLRVLVWRGERLTRVFREEEVTLEIAGRRPAERVAKFPPVMGLLAPEQSTDAPERLIIRAASARDVFTWTLDTNSLAQIVIPAETHLGVVNINEVSARARVQGEIGGQSLDWSGEGIFEFLTA